MQTSIMKSLLTYLCRMPKSFRYSLKRDAAVRLFPFLEKKGKGRFFTKHAPPMYPTTSYPAKKHPLIAVLLFAVCVLSATNCFALEQTRITSENLEYDQNTTTYTAKGNVKLRRGDTVIEADEMEYNEQTSRAVAIGHFWYDDPDILITASRASLNLEKKTGVFSDAEVLYKKGNYHISGKKIEKRGENYYFSPEASATTCDTPLPAWCFSGKDLNIMTDDRLKAKDVSFYLLGLPVLYTPYFYAPALSERKTGFLTPVIGYSSERGMHLNVPYYIVLSENRDATLVLDEYTNRGLGEGMEYRYVELGNAKGKWWFYHISDRKLNKDFLEIRGLHDQRSPDGIGGFLSINYVNEKDFYREYSLYQETRVNRFLESIGEVSIPLKDSRAYLLSQYWVDLQDNSPPVSQKVPEVGYVLNPTKFGSLWFSGTTSFANFLSDEGVRGQRFDIFPRILNSFGDDIVISQALGLRETAYSLSGTEDNSPHRESLEYDVSGHMSLLKKYSSFTHILEPTLSYTLVTNSENNLPTLDSTELFKRTSKVEVSLLNRVLSKGGEILVFRVSQGLDTFVKDNPLLPLQIDFALKKPVALRFEATYDVNTGRLNDTNSDISMKVSETTFSAGYRYNRQNDTTFYTASIGLHPFKPIYLDSRVWYDVKNKQLAEGLLNIRYILQCWGVGLEFIKRPGDFNAVFRFELRGLTRDIRNI